MLHFKSNNKLSYKLDLKPAATKFYWKLQCLFLSIFAFIALSGCSANLSPLSEAAVQNIECKSWTTLVFDQYIENNENQADLNFKNWRDHLNKSLTKSTLSLQQQAHLKIDLTDLFESVFLEIDRIENIDKRDRLLAALEMNLPLTNQHQRTQTKFNLIKAKIQKDIPTAFTKTCDAQISQPSTIDSPQDTKTFQSALSREANRAFVTAYQDCSILNSTPLEKGFPELKGIEVVSKHPTGRSNLHDISDINQLWSSHPYIGKESDHIDNNPEDCFDVRQDPLIYDFGGKPHSSSNADSPLNFFRNHGSGSPVLGVDCSGFVFTAFATAGHKLSPDKPLRARGVLGVNAAMFKNPEGNGLQCLFQVKTPLNKSGLESGDLVASSGHIFIITKLGTNPLGLNNLTSIDECSNISYKNFDFELLQSSGLGEVGIHKSTGAYYLSQDRTMRKGMEKYAQKMCELSFSNSSKITHPEASIVRHKKTSECMTPTKISLTNQSCVQSCFK